MQPFFTQLSAFLESTVLPISNEIDSDRALLQHCHQKWIELGGLGLLVPEEYGGLDFKRPDWIRYTSQLAEYSGAFVFLQAQHQYAMSRLKKLLPDPTIEAVLKSIVAEKKGVGVAFSANKKIIHAERKADGFLLSGNLKWVTGLHYYSDILFSFDNDGFDYYCFLPFKTINSSLTLSPILEPIVFSAVNTVTVTLKDYFISSDSILGSHPFKKKIPFEHPTIYNFIGVSKALLKIASTAKYHHNLLAKRRLTQLLKEWEEYVYQVNHATLNPYELRAAGLTIAEKCLSYAKLVCGSHGLLPSHPITRLSREIWQYSLGGYSEDQLEAYLI